MLSLAAWHWFQPSAEDSTWQLAAAQPLAEGTFLCVKVIDGETLVVRDRTSAPANASTPPPLKYYTVRLLGITGDEDFAGTAATQFLKDAVEGKTLELQWDKRRIDHLGRRLAYVYQDDQLLNTEMVLLGLVRVDSYPGDNGTIARDLGRAEKEARLEQRGLWATAAKAATSAASAQ